MLNNSVVAVRGLPYVTMCVLIGNVVIGIELPSFDGLDDDAKEDRRAAEGRISFS